MSWERFSVAFDVHGDKQSPAAMKAFLEFNAAWKPTHRIIGGDLWDFRPLRGKASADERREGISIDFQYGLDFVDKYKPTAFLLGNHDVRLWNLAERGVGVEADYADKCVQRIDAEFKKRKCPILPYDNRKGIYPLGNLNVIHGFGSGLYAVRRWTQAYGSVLGGHLHTVDITAVEATHRRVGRVCGCLCRLDMEYAITNLASLRWQNGWPYGIVNSKTGEYVVFQAEEINGKYLIPEGVKWI